MKVQSKVSIFSMAFIVACAMGITPDAHAGIFRSKEKKLEKQIDKVNRSQRQIDEDGFRRGSGFIGRKTGKRDKAYTNAKATLAETNAALGASDELMRNANGELVLVRNRPTNTTIEIETTKTTTASTEIDLSQSPLFIDQVNGRCPDGYIPMGDGTCGNSYFRQRGPCADEGKDGNLGQGNDGNLGQGNDGNLGQGNDGNLGQGNDGDLGQGKNPVCNDDEVIVVKDGKNVCAPKPDPVCLDNEKLVTESSGKKKCVPDEHKHVDPVKPVRTKEWCDARGFEFYVGTDGKGHCRTKTKTTQPKKEQPKKEQPKKVEPKKEEPKKEEPKKEEPKKEEPKKEEVKNEECHDPCGIQEVKKEECHDPCGQKTVQNDRTIHVEGDFKNKELVNNKKGFLGLNKIFGRKRVVTGTFSGDVSEDKALDLIEGNYLTANNRKKNLETTPEIGKYEAEYNQKYGIQKSETGGTAN